ncbi:MAG: hypothetical protein LBC87_01740 [Fibromonadaceae bacterium]|jgi:6-pyruvoyl-tetrahydropterin synthase|nr:hypothetical protein [Fibromonadaceae bacterium]
MPEIIKKNDKIKALKEEIKSKFGDKFIIADEDLDDKYIFTGFLRMLRPPTEHDIVYTDEIIAKIKKEAKWERKYPGWNNLTDDEKESIKQELKEHKRHNSSDTFTKTVVKLIVEGKIKI